MALMADHPDVNFRKSSSDWSCYIEFLLGFRGLIGYFICKLQAKMDSGLTCTGNGNILG